jgi:hypothetical protein
MTFLEFLKMREAGGLFSTQGGPERPTSNNTLNNKDMYLKQPGGGGGVTPTMGAAPAAPTAFTGSGPGLGNQQPRRMKKK